MKIANVIFIPFLFPGNSIYTHLLRGHCSRMNVVFDTARICRLRMLAPVFAVGKTSTCTWSNKEKGFFKEKRQM